MFFKWTKILLFIYFEASSYSVCTQSVSFKTVFNLHTTSGVVLDPKEWHHLFALHKALWRHKKPLVVWRLWYYDTAERNFYFTSRFFSKCTFSIVWDISIVNQQKMGVLACVFSEICLNKRWRWGQIFPGFIQ